MGQRSMELAAALEEQFDEMIGFVSGLSPAQLSAPCDDVQGSSVAAVLTHLREGTDLVVGWTAELAGQPAATSAPSTGADDPVGGEQHDHGHDGHDHDHPYDHGHGHGHGHGHDPAAADPAAEVVRTVTSLRDGGTAILGDLRGFTDEQLDGFPAPKPSLTDGTWRLDRIFAYIAEDLAGHRRHLEAAVAAGAAAQDAP